MTRRGTDNITVRMYRALWLAFGEVCKDRSKVIREFVEWYTRQPGAKMPRRPDVTQTASPDHVAEPPHSAT